MPTYIFTNIKKTVLQKLNATGQKKPAYYPLKLPVFILKGII